MIALFFKVFAALFSVVDPFGAMPLFVLLTRDETRRNRNRIARDTALYFVGILVLFYFIGTYIIHFFGISLDAMRITGGFVIFSSGVALMGGNLAKARTVDEKVQAEADERASISLTPLAMPMLAGPGSISLLISLSTTQEWGWHQAALMPRVTTILAIATTGILTYLILRVSPLAFQKLGTAGLNSISRILGFFVMAIGVQYVINGASHVFAEVFGAR